MLTVRPSFSALVALFLAVFITFGLIVEAAPQRQNGNGRGGNNNNNGTQKQTAQERAAQTPQGISRATDGSTILDTTVTVNGLPLRFKISGPADQFTTTSGVTGGRQTPGSQGTLGLNVLLHGDGGQSFFDFPNQAIQQNLAGVVVLAPDPNLFWGGGRGLNRTNGVAHAQAVNDLILNELSRFMAFDRTNVFFTGVSGGALLLSGFFIPQFMNNFLGTGVLLNCAALAPQVNFVNGNAVARSTRIHFQSTQRELQNLQGSIPEAIIAFENLARGAGLNNAQINRLQTVDNSPDGGHCAFDGKGFVSGIQLMADNFANIIQGGNGNVNGIGNVLNGVVGNEQLVFA